MVGHRDGLRHRSLEQSSERCAIAHPASKRVDNAAPCSEKESISKSDAAAGLLMIVGLTILFWGLVVWIALPQWFWPVLIVIAVMMLPAAAIVGATAWNNGHEPSSARRNRHLVQLGAGSEAAGFRMKALRRRASGIH